ncbi:MAG: SpoIID/LytB domain-containing protein [Actinomycetota bacterium]|nr:SpoIID/LytB domain-containing protein [Actinomycetota bacterium]
MPAKLVSCLAVALALALSGGATLIPPRAEAARRDLGAAVAPMRLIPRSSEAISVGGFHSYFGTVELSSASDGLVISNRLSLERYLLGLNEVPLDWPREALRAQAIAARTYALFTLGTGRTGEGAVYGYDICATVQCQVYSGADVINTEDGPRWIEAVQSTAGQAVLYEGAPILARYHSTSGGQTLDNEDAFPGEPAYPYLQSVSSTTERGAPLYRWFVTFTRRDLEAILRRAGWWTEQGKLLSATSAPSSQGLHYPDVVFVGKKGRLRRSAEQLRDVVRYLAPSMFPAKYPSRGPTSSGYLPETFPSNRIDVRTEGRSVRVVGRGWGHGSGMSQWGAHGLALQGASYAAILAHYYTGTTIGTVARTAPIEVGLASAMSSATAAGSFRIVDGRGKTLVRRALGTWSFSPAGAGAVAISPPRGFGLPLEVGIVKAPKRVIVGQPAFLTVALSRPAKVRTATADSPTGYRDPGVEIKDAGRRRVVWLAPLEEGRYRVRVYARAGPILERSEPVDIVVREAAATRDLDAGSGAGEPQASSPRVVAWAVAGAAGLALLLLFSLVRRANRSADS